MQLIDTHCHLDFPEYDADFDEVCKAAIEAGVGTVVIPGFQPADWDRLMACCQNISVNAPQRIPAPGVHPWCAPQANEQLYLQLEMLATSGKITAIGEIGLDKIFTQVSLAKQRHSFGVQLEIAEASGLPVLLHVRKMHDETIAMLKHYRLCGGIVHAFNGSLQQAAQYMELDFALGFGGMLTRPQSRKLRHLAAHLPLSSLVLETDAPGMAPSRYLGLRNQPAWLVEVAEELATVRDSELTEVIQQTTTNAQKILGLSKTTKYS